MAATMPAWSVGVSEWIVGQSENGRDGGWHVRTTFLLRNPLRTSNHQNRNSTPVIRHTRPLDPQPAKSRAAAPPDAGGIPAHTRPPESPRPHRPVTRNSL